jgi:maltooligosyltrehalose trehalohydrolase
MTIRDFRVWAPRAESVALVTGETDYPMNTKDGHWFEASLQLAGSGEPIDYGFRLDGAEKVLPDPRSRWQPHGVHGLSRVFDPAEYAWGDATWTGRRLAGGVLYEMHVGTFTPEGTFDAAIGRLDHLLSIGVDQVEILPVNGFDGHHNWGYDGVLWFAVHDAYGGPRGYQRFVDACHQRGIAVVQDVVYNHLGKSGSYLQQFGPYLNDEGLTTTWGESVNLDGPLSDEVRRYILDNIAMWLRDYHVDGLRLDAVHALHDTNAVHLLEDIATLADCLSPHVRRPLSLIAESDLNDPKLITAREIGGFGLTAQWNDDFHHVVHVALTGETVGYYADFGPVSAIAKVITKGFFHDGTYSSFRGRDHGRPVDTLVTPSWRFVAYTQNHDQIGNRAAGDRLTAHLSHDELALAAVLLLTSPFTPMLFMGEEWAARTPWAFFVDHPNEELARATREGRMAEFERMGWNRNEIPDPQDDQTFLRSKLDWSEPEREGHREILELYRRLIALRRKRAELTDPRFGRNQVEFDDDERWLIVDRSGVRIALNLSAEERTVSLAAPAGAVLLQTGAGGSVEGDALRLGPHSSVVLAPATA